MLPSTKTEVEQPILVGCNKRINSRISSCHEAATRIEGTLNRLLNPAPHSAKDDQVKPQPQTLEALLNETDTYADSLATRLHDLAERLERAA